MKWTSFITVFEWVYFKLLKNLQGLEPTNLYFVGQHPCENFPVSSGHTIQK